ncbi:enoyl-CoA hydratase/isomerase family protein [Pseudonocardia pini]|uniref:enoyl-CoA hydratase/isomerase family protein n=1 Tax=Pseudonocardia pini TaxID=2758030 RepID=UPI0015F0090B|nr:enoyl-CoA hydratase/isomerase family protein [Pseudonocardia pini]
MDPVVHRRMVEPGIGLLELDRPERLNAISPQLLGELHAALAELAEDRECRVVVLTGRGRGFCAGLDLQESHGGDTVPDRMRLQKRIASLVPALRALPQPVVAAVNGPAAGGGLALALASDVRIAGESARFGNAFVRIGLSGGDVGVSWLLPRLIGASRAFELLLTGRVVDAREADRIGLVSRVVPDADLRESALAVAREIVANSPFGVRMTKDVMWAQLEAGSLAAGIALENSTQIAASETADQTEAARAFLERRPPEFTDS